MQITKVSNASFHRSNNIDPSPAFDKNDVLSVLLASAKLNGAYSSVKSHLLQDMCGSDSMSCNCCPITPSPSFELKQVTTRNACHTSPSLNISTLLYAEYSPCCMHLCQISIPISLRARVWRSCSTNPSRHDAAFKAVEPLDSGCKI